MSLESDAERLYTAALDLVRYTEDVHQHMLTMAEGDRVELTFRVFAASRVFTNLKFAAKHYAKERANAETKTA